MKIPVRRRVLAANDDVAGAIRAELAARRIVAVNVMASPGAGKTSVIGETARKLPPHIRIGAIEGDLAGRIDTERLLEDGIPAVQINTGGGCHLDAPMLREALPHLPLDRLDLVFIENVGNLVCPAEFDLGESLRVVIASVPEGHDKPYKYPAMFASADAVLLNKADLLPYIDFDRASFEQGIAAVNPGVPVIALSCRTGEGLGEWISWLTDHLYR